MSKDSESSRSLGPEYWKRGAFWAWIFGAGFSVAVLLLLVLVILPDASGGKVGWRVRQPLHRGVCTEMMAQHYGAHVQVLRGDESLLLPGDPARCDGSLDRHGNTQFPRYKLRSTGTTYFGDRYEYVIYHETGELHKRVHGDLHFDFAAFNPHGDGNVFSISVPSYDDAEYWDWFERFDKGEATIDDYIGYEATEFEEAASVERADAKSVSQR